MKKIVIYLYILAITASISACEKVIDIKVANDSGKLVIEGAVTDQAGQTIKLSRNVAFTSTNTYPAVTGATVSVTDQNGKVYAFTEGAAGTYTNAALTGASGQTYQMNVNTGNQTYTATSTMPLKVALDSITSADSDFGGKGKKKITVHFHDPVATADQYNFLLFVNGKQVTRVFTVDDRFTNGNDINFDLRTGNDDNDQAIYAGDNVTVQMQCIDHAVFTYWFSLQQQGTGSGPGGSVSPSNPPTNITPAVFGYFSAQTVQSKTIVVK
ncbi:uncharacterized protein DUF4249 [Mucilaginibacter yixingensis]|uniref:Uncharacterized protein DUF4249 n=1 Tax=Mucilaginibacter yixingensis TaxID=1295612 RepID=A0A2T5J963_9SPHI|nr:DUF4249 domain-containing protein [Mucilaginibacter yixingensis]PTQ96611.1 uncharacterized protein DUF4249 [Mucilaginibacter yixingensis]